MFGGLRVEGFEGCGYEAMVAYLGYVSRVYYGDREICGCIWVVPKIRASFWYR